MRNIIFIDYAFVEKILKVNFVMFYTYIIYSSDLNLYYKGFTTDFPLRLEYHNSGKSPYTSKATDWKKVYLKSFETKKEALIEEKRLKRLNIRSIEKLIKEYSIATQASE